MTDPKYPALLAAEHWLASEQTRSDLTQSAHGLVRGWMEDTLRSLARVAFVAGYGAGKKARGESIVRFCKRTSEKLDTQALTAACAVRAMALTVPAAQIRILATKIEYCDDENAPD